MVTLEQVRQLEAKIGKAIDYVNRVSGENIRLRGELDGNEKRIAELEETIQRFREEQGRIEEGILAALDRLDQFEDAVNKGLSNVQAVVAAAAPSVPVTGPDPAKPASEAPLGATPQDALPGEEPSGKESPDRAGNKESGGEPEEEASGNEPGGNEPGDNEPDDEEAGADELDLF
jgi:TolA-binding protein